MVNGAAARPPPGRIHPRSTTTCNTGPVEGWKLLGNCVGKEPDIFFPDTAYNRDEVKTAKDICAVCLVRAQCMDYALRHDEVGIWGGTTERERKKIKNRYVRHKVQEAMIEDLERFAGTL
jgi:WhiB family transcriptional regulator, redox-sensing transcriptional regulator